MRIFDRRNSTRIKKTAAKFVSRRSKIPHFERLEDRATPANVTDLAGVLSIDFSSLNESVNVNNSGSGVSLSGSVFGGAGAGPFAGVTRIVVTDSGNLAGQSVTFGGGTFVLPDGLSTNGVEYVYFNQPVDCSGGMNSILVNAPQSVIVSQNLTGGSGAGGGVSLTGAGTVAADTVGISVANDATVTAAGNGPVTLNGTSGGSGTIANDYGVILNTGNVTSGGGDVSVTGPGRRAVYLQNGEIESGGTGKVNVRGNGTGDVAVFVLQESTLTSSGGNVTVTGVDLSGGAGVFERLDGVISAGGTGTVTVSGTGGTGVALIETGTEITSSGGAISVTGAATGSGDGIEMEFGAAGIVSARSNAPISVTADSYDSSSPINAGAGTVTIVTLTAGTQIDLGGSDVTTGSPLTLGISNAELALITAGTLHIGNGTGPVTIHQGTNLGGAGGGGGGGGSSGGNVVIQSNAPTVLTSDLTLDINGSSASSSYTQLNIAGQIDLNSVNLILSGTYVPQAGDQYTIIRGDKIHPILGTFNGLAEGSTLFINGVKFRISYAGGDGTDVVLTIAAITVGISGVSQNEGNAGFTAFQFPVTLVNGPLSSNQTFKVQYTTGTANGNDFQSAAGTVTFLPGQSTAMITVNVFGNYTPQSNRTFSVNLSNPILTTGGVAAAGNLSNTQAIGIILDDDSTTLSVSIANGTVTKPTSGTAPMSFTAVLNAAPATGQYVTVNYTASNAGTGPGFATGNDYQGSSGTLTFLANTTTPVTPRTVLVCGNTQVNPVEIFNVKRSTPVLHFTGTNQSYPANIGTALATGTIQSQRPNAVVSIAAGPAVTPSATGTTMMTFTISYTGTISSSIVVNYATQIAGTGAGNANGNMFLSAAGQVTFTPTGSHTATVTVMIYAQKTPLPTNEIFDVVLTMPTGQTLYTLGTSTGIGTING